MPAPIPSASSPRPPRPDAIRRAAPDTAARLARMRRLAWLIDAAFVVPGTGYRFGLNSIIGLVPGAGDAALGLVSLYIVQQAHTLGVPRPILARMVGNVAIEVAGGSIPIIGDLFDVALKANLRNIRLVEQHVATRKAFL